MAGVPCVIGMDCMVMMAVLVAIIVVIMAVGCYLSLCCQCIVLLSLRKKISEQVELANQHNHVIC